MRHAWNDALTGCRHCGAESWTAHMECPASPAPTVAAPREPDAEFKNFHRLLCERFDYVHDERDWKRDQLSLIEWIAKRASPPAQPASSEGEREAFESAALVEGLQNFGSDEYGDGYADRQVDTAWRLWQARAAQQTAQPDAEREALVKFADSVLVGGGDGTYREAMSVIRDLRDYINRGSK